MTREEAKAEINNVFEPAFANYIITALTEGATPSEHKSCEWNEIKKRPMDDEERKEWRDELGYDIADEDAFVYYNLPEESEEVFITTSWGSVTTDIIEYDGGFYWEEHDMEDVVAWMPLPKPHKVESVDTK